MIASKRVTIIFNPHAGAGKSFFPLLQQFLGISSPTSSLEHDILYCVEKIKHTLLDTGWDVAVAPTEHVGHATELARGATASSGLIVAIGGDGTIHEIVNGITPSTCGLAVLPFGTSNVFALQLNLPANLADFCTLLTGPHLFQTIDLGFVNDRYFVCMLGIGLDAEIIRHTDTRTKKKLGALAYALAFFKILIWYHPTPFWVRTDESADLHKAYFAVIGNTQYYGGAFVLADQANLTDGKLDVCLFQSTGLFSIFRYIRGVLTQSLSRQPGLRYIQAEHISVTSRRYVSVHLDAEPFESLPLQISVAPNALRVLVPSLIS